MTKLNWEKRNRIELPKQKRRESQRTKILKAYANGCKNERERIISLIAKMPVLSPHQAIEVRYLIEEIRGQND